MAETYKEVCDMVDSRDDPRPRPTPSPDRFYVVTRGPVPRVTCIACEKSEHLPDEPGAYEALKESHRCGERTSPWDSYGQTR